MNRKGVEGIRHSASNRICKERYHCQHGPSWWAVRAHYCAVHGLIVSCWTLQNACLWNQASSVLTSLLRYWYILVSQWKPVFPSPATSSCILQHVYLLGKEWLNKIFTEYSIWFYTFIFHYIHHLINLIMLLGHFTLETLYGRSTNRACWAFKWMKGADQLTERNCYLKKLWLQKRLIKMFKLSTSIAKIKVYH